MPLIYWCQAHVGVGEKERKQKKRLCGEGCKNGCTEKREKGEMREMTKGKRSIRGGGGAD